MSTTDFRELCERLSAERKSGDEWVCKCPAHEDSNPSLWLRESDSGKILLHCFGGCSQADVIAALVRMELWDGEKLSQAQRSTPPGIPYFWPPAALLRKKNLTPGPDNQKAYAKHWAYRDLSGKIVGHVARYEGHGKKDVIPFFQRWAENGSWRSGHSLKSGRPVFNQHLLPILRNSRINPPSIFIVEGEKCAEALTDKESGIIALTWPGGSKSFSRADWGTFVDYFTECGVTLWPDNDSAGVAAANGIRGILRRLEPSINIKIVDLTQFGEKPKGWDCADWIAEGNKPADAVRLALSEGDELGEQEKKVRSDPDQDHNNSENEQEPMRPRYALTDVGNGQRFVAAHGENIRYALGRGWLCYNGSYWESDHETLVYQMAARVAESISLEAAGLEEEDAKPILKWCSMSQSVSRIEAMLKMAKSMPGVTVEADTFDPDPYLLSLKNGVLNLRTGELLEPRREFLITKAADAAFDSSAECPIWNKFIFEIMNGEQELISFLQRAIGYSLTGSTEEQILFLLWGDGSNGKSVFVETIKSIFGTYAMATDASMLLLDSRGDAATGSNSIARLQNARLVVGSEVPPGARFNEARVKELTGQDTISARFLFKEYFDYVPDFKFWIRSNDRPEIRGEDVGIWRRIVCIPFTASFTEEQKDKHLRTKLLGELSGILNWAIAGCLEWQRTGLRPPEAVRETVSNYRAEMDVLGEWLGTRCELSEESYTSSSALYLCYTEWCKENNEKPHSHRKISMALRKRGFKRFNFKDARYYKGIKIKAFVSEGSGEFEHGFTPAKDDQFIF